VNRGIPPPWLLQAPKKLVEDRYEAFLLLDVGQVATASDEFEGTFFEASEAAVAYL